MNNNKIEHTFYSFHRVKFANQHVNDEQHDTHWLGEIFIRCEYQQQ